MYKIITWRYGVREILDDFDTPEEAVKTAQYLSDEGACFYECIIDSEDIIVRSNNYVFGDFQNEIGKKYEYN